MSYSLDFRKQVFKIKEKEGLTYQQTSECFGIFIRTLFHWNKELLPRTSRNRPAIKIDMEALRNHVEEYPDAYQYERAAFFGVSPNGILYALRRLNISHKKNDGPSQSGR